MKRIVRFLTQGTRLENVSYPKLIALAVATIIVVFASGIDRKSSTLVESFLDPDNLINFAIDWRSDTPNGIAVTVVDIDDATFETWGEPLSTPRRRLFELVEAVQRRGASSIVVDIDILANSTVQEAILTIDRLAAYSRLESTKATGIIPLILVRSLWSDDDSAHELTRLPEFDRERISQATSRIEDLVTRGSENGDHPSLMWGAALFRTDYGGLIRHWRLIEPICDDKSRPRAIPSIGLIIAAISQKGKQNIASLRLSAQSYAQRYCSNPGPRLPTALPEFNWLTVDSQYVRLPYLFWPTRSEPFRFGTGRASDGRIVPLIDIRSAGTLLDREKAAVDNYGSPSFCDALPGVMPPPLTCQAVEGRVVLIGSSHRDNHDRHFTPLGPMPGAYVLANTIAGAGDTLLNSDRFNLGSRFWAVVLFFALALIAARLRSLFAVASGALLALAFLSFVAGRLTIPVSQSYESVNSAMVMLAIFLPLAAVLPGLEKWPKALIARLSRRHVKRPTD